jgi:hypothetical protein
MANHEFRMRLFARYADSENAIADLEVEVLTESGWEMLDLDTRTAGFLLFVYTIFTCQHMYLRTNCAERGLVLESSTGTIELIADEDWKVRQLHVAFKAVLQSGVPGPDDTAYIAGRMEQCPVSRNLVRIPDASVELQLD